MFSISIPITILSLFGNHFHRNNDNDDNNNNNNNNKQESVYSKLSEFYHRYNAFEQFIRAFREGWNTILYSLSNNNNEENEEKNTLVDKWNQLQSMCFLVDL